MAKCPPNSATREFETPNPSDRLQRYGETSKEFAEATLSTEPREIPQEVASEREEWTGTSAAKDALERRVDKLMDRFDETTREFNRVNNHQQSDESQRGRGSSMVENDSADHSMNPTRDIRERVDRIAFDERWETERKEAQQVQGISQER